MTGLEKILKAIEEQAQAQADTVIAQAKKTAEEILTKAVLEADKICNQTAEKSATDVKSAISRFESAAALQEKKIFLTAKQEIISNIIKNARMSLVNLPDVEFTDMMLQMIKKYAHKAKGEIIFSTSDKKRLAKDFDQRLEAALSDIPDAQLTLSDKNANIDGGFILVYGDVEENCSFEAIFSAAKDDLLDKVNSLLFEQ
jgi:V/A-type H+-transporting ATPase subunit E